MRRHSNRQQARASLRQTFVQEVGSVKRILKVFVHGGTTVNVTRMVTSVQIPNNLQ